MQFLLAQSQNSACSFSAMLTKMQLRHSRASLAEARRVIVGRTSVLQTRCKLRASTIAKAVEQHEETKPLQLVLYTKEECPLCQGLQEKLDALISRAQFMPCLLTDANLEVRDITTNDAWMAAYQDQVPVIALITEGNQEVIIPRPPPRITADRLQKHLETAISQLSDQ